MTKEALWKETKIFVYCLLAAGVGAVLGSQSWAAHSPAIAPVAAAVSAPATAGSIETSFAPIVDRDLPAVVNISSSKKTKVSSDDFNLGQGMDPFFRQFFGRDFGRGAQIPRNRVEHSLGSGVIVRSDGYLLTNNHVIDGATDITITMHDKRELKARVVGTDPKTDIAVLKVDATNLPAIPMADSAKAHVGDVVLAMGNPFGLGQTVTMGIVSAQGRTNLGIEDYEDFIQTDAAINPGNSGGALINAKGELLGINTAILGNNGGNQGVGFAVPVNLARNVMNQVMDHGKVVRGYLGVMPQNITPSLAKTFNLKDSRGVLIGDVTPGAPAEKAGLQRGDVVLEVNGETVEDSNQLRMKISLMAPGTTANLRVLHDGAEKSVSVKLGELPTTTADNSDRRGLRNSEDATKSALDGVSVEASRGKGVVVTDVDPASSAASAGLREGDVIQEVNRAAVNNLSDFNRAVNRSERASNQTLLLLVQRSGYTQYIAIAKS
jgi:serine protease Do